ncbi:MAG TPA: HAMP domain-containing sensor histidine kinase [Rubrivivax sp.]|nr:HAMP domain-containing sensor histidine kinase [Rubrivivax sp.]
MAAARSAPLARQTLRWLALLFVAVELLTIGSAAAFVMVPMARRAADDLAGLMLLSAQTWAVLPPPAQARFEQQLQREHRLALRPGMTPPPEHGPHRGFYVRFLEQALAQRSGQMHFFRAETGADGGEWLWTTVQAGGGPVGVGFAYARIGTQPLWALAVALLTGTALVVAVAWWMARRISKPVARLEQAAAALASGARPQPLAESGPRELAQLAAHFNHMAAQVRELLDARTTLLAGLSHDLRTPLARIRLSLELLRLRPEPALIERLEADVEAMNVLIGQLLDLARGLDHETPGRIELAPWLQSRVQALAGAAGEAAGRLEVRCPPALHVHAAAGMLGRVLDNLLGNALSHSPGPVELVAAAAGDGSDGGVIIDVLDRGPGIPAAQVESVWRPFQQLEGSRSRQSGGYGLGLAIVRQLAATQGWQVALAAREGGGLQARVVLPGVARVDRRSD